MPSVSKGLSSERREFEATGFTGKRSSRRKTAKGYGKEVGLAAGERSRSRRSPGRLRKERCTKVKTPHALRLPAGLQAGRNHQALWTSETDVRSICSFLFHETPWEMIVNEF
jgi:hypothetical protein